MKYRVFDKKNGRYLDPKSVAIMQDGSLMVAESAEIECDGSFAYCELVPLDNSDGRYVVEMCSPLKDLDGHELYEGDEVVCSYNDGKLELEVAKAFLLHEGGGRFHWSYKRPRCTYIRPLQRTGRTIHDKEVLND